jgi:site-specific recombinase XerD
MINELFTLSSTIERLRQGPLDKHLDAYAAVVAEQGYAPNSIRSQIVVIADLSQWLQQKRIAVPSLDSNVLDRFLKTLGRQGGTRRGDGRALNRLLTLLRQTGIVKPDRERTVESPRQCVTNGFQHYLLQERRLSTATPHNYLPVIEQFLSERFPRKALNLSAICAVDVTDFVRRHAHQLSPGRAALMVTALRSFFRYLLHRGDVATDLAACVSTVPKWKFSVLPRFLSADSVQRVPVHGLLASTGRIRQTTPRSQARMVGAHKKCAPMAPAFTQQHKLSSRRRAHLRRVEGSGERDGSLQCGAACSTESPAAMCSQACWRQGTLKCPEGASQLGKMVKVLLHG